jgi:hypothetical protein
MEQDTSGAELLLSEPEFVAWLGLEQNDDHRTAPLWRVTVGILPDAPEALVARTSVHGVRGVAFRDHRAW